MTETPQIAVAWCALFLGLFSVATALGELRIPGMWRRMIQEMETSPALQITLGLVELALGVFIYAATGPWDSGDWLGVVMKVIAGLMVFEALIVCAFADHWSRFWTRRLASDWRGWAVICLLIGLWLTFAALYRFYLAPPY
jgi:uncharacterized protein YjeT (DUF2065 family)